MCYALPMAKTMGTMTQADFWAGESAWEANALNRYLDGPCCEEQDEEELTYWQWAFEQADKK
jgi:hypothetical protein